MRYVNSVARLEYCPKQNLEVLIDPSKAGSVNESPVAYIATRSIRRGEELFIDYGPQVGGGCES